MRQLLLLLFAVSLVSAAEEELLNYRKGNIDFTAKSYQKFAETVNDNILICGLSAEIVLSLLAHGAKGRTQTELFQALSEDKTSLTAYRQLIPRLNQNTTDFKLLSANRIYAADDFKILNEFRKISEDPYEAGIESVNFADNIKTTDIINDWVASNTNYKITDLISPDLLTANTRMVLVNTLYLNGLWRSPFNEGATKKQVFHSSDTESKEIDMMHVEDSYGYRDCGFYKAQFLEIPIIGGLTFTVILPHDINGLPDLESKLDGLLAVGNLDSQRVSVTLPKFTTRSKIDFRDILQKLGVRSIFEDANLTGISTKEGLRVDFVLQQTFINVTESGVEAAAATAVGVELTSLQPSAKASFVADHPFLYHIKDNDSGIILFAGKFRVGGERSLPAPLPPSTVFFIADHPFLYFIRDNDSGVILFAAGIARITSVGESFPTTVIFKADYPFIYFIRDNDSGVILFVGKFVK